MREKYDGNWGNRKQGQRICRWDNGCGSLIGRWAEQGWVQQAKKLLRGYGLPHLQDGGEYRFKDILALWMEHNKVRQKGGTMVKYQFMIDHHINPELGELRASQITATKINSYLAEKLEHGRMDENGGLSPSYVRTIAIIINSALQFAADEEICRELKTQIYKPAAVKQELPILQLEDQRRLEKHISNKLTPTNVGVMISLHAGLRIGEVCALAWKDVDLENRILHVRHTVARVQACSEGVGKTQLILDTPKTKASMRDIPISSILYPILLRARALSESPFVVSKGEKFTSPRTYEYRYHKLLQECGIEGVNYHALRHTFATRCTEAGVDVKSLSEMLGHANVSVTLETYVHSSMRQKRAQLEKLSAICV